MSAALVQPQSSDIPQIFFSVWKPYVQENLLQSFPIYVQENFLQSNISYNLTHIILQQALKVEWTNWQQQFLIVHYWVQISLFYLRIWIKLDKPFEYKAKATRAMFQKLLRYHLAEQLQPGYTVRWQDLLTDKLPEY